MTSNNMFFEQAGRKMYGQQFGYAIAYSVTQELGEHCVRFADHMIMPEELQNTKKPHPIDLVSECVYELIKERQNGIVTVLYERRVRFTEKDSMYDIKREIREIQKSLISISNEAAPDVKRYLQSQMLEYIRSMPVH